MKEQEATLIIITLPQNGKLVGYDCVKFEKAKVIDYDVFDARKIKDHRTSWTYNATNKASKYLGINFKISIMYGVGNMTPPYNIIFAGIPRVATEKDKIKIKTSLSKFIIPNRFKGIVSKNGNVAPDYVFDDKVLRAIMKEILGDN